VLEKLSPIKSFEAAPGYRAAESAGWEEFSSPDLSADCFSRRGKSEQPVYNFAYLTRKLPGFVSPQRVYISTPLNQAPLSRQERTSGSGRSLFAAREDQAVRKLPLADSSHAPYTRDAETIKRSLEFNDLRGKTQVFLFPASYDMHICNRQRHSLQVAKVALRIGKELGLNPDLIEAVALGHDLGHTPFGHSGERFLSEICKRQGIGEFYHNVHSLEVVDRVADNGKGLNLTLQVRDGILMHDGETDNDTLVPQPKTDADLEQYCRDRKNGIKPRMNPMTLEGCVVRISDQIAYLGEDFEDAIQLGVLKRRDLPKGIAHGLGNNQAKMLNTMIDDIVESSRGKNYITSSSKLDKLVDQFKAFNYARIYLNPLVKPELDTIQAGFETIFAQSLQDLSKHDTDSPIYRKFLHYRPGYAENAKPAEVVRDFVATLTDQEFVEVLRHMERPKAELLKNQEEKFQFTPAGR